MRVAAVIVAAGRGLRLGETVPKQYLRLGTKAVLRHGLDTFLAHPAIASVQVVIGPEDGDAYAVATEGLSSDRLRAPVPGAESRAGSVLAGAARADAVSPVRTVARAVWARAPVAS